MGDIKKKWGWLLALGILMLGSAGFGAAFVLTITTVLFFAVLFIIGGVAQLVDTFAIGAGKQKWGIF